MSLTLLMAKDYFPRLIDSHSHRHFWSHHSLLLLLLLLSSLASPEISMFHYFQFSTSSAAPSRLTHTYLPLCALIRLSVLASNRRWPPAHLPAAAPTAAPTAGRFLPLFLFPLFAICLMHSLCQSALPYPEYNQSGKPACKKSDLHCLACVQHHPNHHTNITRQATLSH